MPRTQEQEIEMTPIQNGESNLVQNGESNPELEEQETYFSSRRGPENDLSFQALQKSIEQSITSISSDIDVLSRRMNTEEDLQYRQTRLQEIVEEKQRMLKRLKQFKIYYVSEEALLENRKEQSQIRHRKKAIQYWGSVDDEFDDKEAYTQALKKVLWEKYPNRDGEELEIEFSDFAYEIHQLARQCPADKNNPDFIKQRDVYIAKHLEGLDKDLWLSQHREIMPKNFDHHLKAEIKALANYDCQLNSLADRVKDKGIDRQVISEKASQTDQQKPLSIQYYSALDRTHDTLACHLDLKKQTLDQYLIEQKSKEGNDKKTDQDLLYELIDERYPQSHFQDQYRLNQAHAKPRIKEQSRTLQVAGLWDKQVRQYRSQLKQLASVYLDDNQKCQNDWVASDNFGQSQALRAFSDDEIADLNVLVQHGVEDEPVQTVDTLAKKLKGGRDSIFNQQEIDTLDQFLRRHDKAALAKKLQLTPIETLNHTRYSVQNKKKTLLQYLMKELDFNAPSQIEKQDLEQLFLGDYGDSHKKLVNNVSNCKNEAQDFFDQLDQHIILKTDDKQFRERMKQSPVSLILLLIFGGKKKPVYNDSGELVQRPKGEMITLINQWLERNCQANCQNGDQKKFQINQDDSFDILKKRAGIWFKDTQATEACQRFFASFDRRLDKKSQGGRVERVGADAPHKLPEQRQKEIDAKKVGNIPLRPAAPSA